MKLIIENKWIDQFLKFGIVGILNNLIYITIYYIINFIGINYIIANTIAFFVSVLNAYFCNKKFVFKDSNKNFKQLFKTYVAYGITFIISTSLLFLMVEKLAINTYLAPLINLTITIPLNFLLNKFWTFKQKEIL